MSLLQHRPLIRATRLGYPVCARLAPHLQYSSGSPTATPIPDDYFNKTGQKAASDPALINMRTDEYSKSGGDDVVAEQVIASFKSVWTTDPAVEKMIAGRGNVINPLEISPASPEVSRILEERIVEKNMDRLPNAKTGPGVTRKMKRVVKNEIDFRSK